MAVWRVELDVDDRAAYAAFATDRLWCAYAIADLEPPVRAHSRVAVARSGADVAACLVLRHPAFNALVPHGAADGLAAILGRLALPPELHLFARDEHLDLLRRHLAYPAPTPMLRMAVDATTFRAPAAVGADRLGPDDLPALLDLYDGYAGSAFHPDQLAPGVFYGVRDGRRLLAAAGTHVVSGRRGIAAVGNIYTRPEARGRGLGGAVTGAVVGELLAGPCRDAVLNVAAANEPAIRVYTRLGFRTHCRHYEGIASHRAAVRDTE
jgi:ribosomal protein S18 acetylase RimI-like enzyme